MLQMCKSVFLAFLPFNLQAPGGLQRSWNIWLLPFYDRALTCSTCCAWHRVSGKKERVPPVLVARGTAFDADVWQNALILVDKPYDWTSANVCSKLRGATRAKKVRARACPPSCSLQAHANHTVISFTTGGPHGGN